MQMETQLQRIHRQSTQTPQMLQNMRNTIHRLQHGLRPMPQKVPSQTHKRSRRRTRTQNMRRMRRQNKPIHHRMQNMHETPMEPSKKANLPTRRLTCSKCGYAMIYRNSKCKTCKSREESNKKRGKPPLIRLTTHGPEPKPKKRATPDPHITEMPPGLAAYIRARRARLKKKISH